MFLLFGKEAKIATIIKPAIKHCNDVILSDAKNLAFSFCYEILHSVQDDNYNCRVNRKKRRLKPAATKGFKTAGTWAI
jgi:hypothetical protein